MAWIFPAWLFIAKQWTSRSASPSRALPSGYALGRARIVTTGFCCATYTSALGRAGSSNLRDMTKNRQYANMLESSPERVSEEGVGLSSNCVHNPTPFYEYSKSYAMLNCMDPQYFRSVTSCYKRKMSNKIKPFRCLSLNNPASWHGACLYLRAPRTPSSKASPPLQGN